MIKLSYSLIKDYMSCNHRAFLRVNSPETAEKSQDMIVGTLVHKAIQLYPRELYNTLFSHVQKNSAGLDSAHMKKASRCLNNYFKSFSTFLDRNAKFEHRFSYDMGNIKIVGIFDGVDNDNVIVDWKTSEKVPSSDELSDDLQFNLYYEIYRRIYGKTPQLFYISLAKNIMLEFVPNSDNIDTLFNRIIPEVNFRINFENVWVKDGIFKNQCNYCQFYNHCRVNQDE